MTDPSPPSEAAPPADTGWGRALRRRAWGIGAGLLFGAFALSLALYGVPLRSVQDALAETDPVWLLLPALLFLLQQAVRAWRQALLIRASHPAHRFRDSLSVLCVSFFFINTLPARMGEVVRPLLLLEREDIPLGQGFAVVFVERAIDLAAMIGMLSLAAWFVPMPSHRLVVGGAEFDPVEIGRRLAGVTLPLLLLGLLALVLGGERLLDRIEPAVQARLPAHPRLGRLAAVLLAFSRQFVSGIRAIRDPKRLAAVLALTVLTWTLTAAMYGPAARAFHLPVPIGMGEGVAILGMTMAGMALPAAPGMAGTYEAFVRAALALLGVSGSTPLHPGGPTLDALAVAYALVMHWGLNLVQSASALVFLVLDRISVRRLALALGRSLGGLPGDTAQQQGVAR